MAIRLSSKRQEISNVNKDVGNEIPLYTVAGDVSWYSHYGKQYDGSSKN